MDTRSDNSNTTKGADILPLVLHNRFVLKKPPLHECETTIVFRGTDKGVEKGKDKDQLNSKTAMDKLGPRRVIIIFKTFEASLQKKNKQAKIESKIQDLRFVPKRLWKGLIKNKDGKTTQKVFVNEMVGPPLKALFHYNGRNFSLETVSVIAIEIVKLSENPIACKFVYLKLNIMEELHKKEVVFWNLKPNKIYSCLQLNKINLYIDDFKFAQIIKKSFQRKMPENLATSNIKPNLNKFSSLNSHLGIGPSPKDDLESLSYCLKYFLNKGEVFPIKKDSNSTRTSKHTYYYQQKLQIIPEVFFSPHPLEFVDYFNYVKQLSYDQDPDYQLMRNFFKGILKRSSTFQDISKFTYDWNEKIMVEGHVKDVSNESDNKKDGIVLDNKKAFNSGEIKDDFFDKNEKNAILITREKNDNIFKPAKQMTESSIKDEEMSEGSVLSEKILKPNIFKHIDDLKIRYRKELR